MCVIAGILSTQGQGCVLCPRFEVSYPTSFACIAMSSCVTHVKFFRLSDGCSSCFKVALHGLPPLAVVTVDELRTSLADRVGTRTDNLRLVYKDENGDFVHLRSDAAVARALEAVRGTALRLFYDVVDAPARVSCLGSHLQRPEVTQVALDDAMRDDPAFCRHPFQSAKKAFDELLPGAPTMTSLRAESSGVPTADESPPRPRAEQEIGKLREATGPGGLDDVLAFLAADLNMKKAELDPRIQSLLLESCDSVSQAITSALCSLVEIYCRVSLHARGLRTLKVVQAQKEFADAAEKKFVAAVAVLRTQHNYSWDAIEGLQMHLKEAQRGIFVEWVRFARYSLKGLAHDRSAHDVFFLAVCGLADSVYDDHGIVEAA